MQHDAVSLSCSHLAQARRPLLNHDVNRAWSGASCIQVRDQRDAGWACFNNGEEETRVGVDGGGLEHVATSRERGDGYGHVATEDGALARDGGEDGEYAMDLATFRGERD